MVSIYYPTSPGENRERPHNTISCGSANNGQWRHGDDKLVVSKGGSGEPELYNLARIFPKLII